MLAPGMLTAQFEAVCSGGGTCREGLETVSAAFLHHAVHVIVSRVQHASS